MLSDTKAYSSFLKTFLFVVFVFIQAFVLYKIFEKKEEDFCHLNITEVLKKYSGMKEAHKEYETAKKKWQDTLDILLAQVEKVSTGPIFNKESEYEAIRTYNHYRDILQQRSIDWENKTTKNIIVQVKSFSKTFADRYGYRIIFGSDDLGVVFYSNQSIDRTDLFISELNNYYHSKKSEN